MTISKSKHIKQLRRKIRKQGADLLKQGKEIELLKAGLKVSEKDVSELSAENLELHEHLAKCQKGGTK